MLDLVKVGKPRQEYKNWKDQTFLSLDEYLLAARKAISYFGRRLRNGLDIEMLSSEDCVSDVAYMMMKADWQYDSSEEMTQYNFRNNYALFAIRSYMTRRQRKSKQPSAKTRSLNDSIVHSNHKLYDSKEIQLYTVTIDKKAQDPAQIVDDAENRQFINSKINDSSLSKKEEYCINEYYSNHKTYNDIGTELNLTKERVRQIINNAMIKIRRNISCLSG